MDKIINLYGRGDVKSVSLTRCFELDFKKSYGLDLQDFLNCPFSNISKFDTKIEYLRYERYAIHPEEVRKIKANPEMYPPLKLAF